MQENSVENKVENENVQPKTKKVKRRVILVLIFAILACIVAYVSYRGNYLETIEIGENFKQVFTQNFKYQYAIIGVNFIIIYIAISLANRSIKKGLKAFFDEEKKEMPKLPNKSIAFILSIIVSVIVSVVFLQSIELFINKAWFGINDPIFNSDIGFYIFEQPLFETLIL